MFYILSLGILARDIPSDKKDLVDQNISPISIVVCNLYPFEAQIAKPDCTLPAAVEEIDIGGVTLLRAAAKNHDRVSILSDPKDYDTFLKSWTETKGEVDAKVRRELALKAFESTAAYDAAISDYFRAQYASSDLTPEALSAPVQRMPLRYGANPHQKPAQAFVASGELPFKGKSYASYELERMLSRPSSSRRLAWIYQPARRPEFLRTGERAQRGTEPSSRRFLQARLPRGCCCRH